MLNRQGLFDVIEQQMAACADTGGSFAVLMLRARGLREIALRFGYLQGEHAGGIAQELIAMSLRPVDRVFRTGDDTFAIVLADMLSRNHGLLAAARLSQTFEQPLVAVEAPWQLRIVMGTALYPEHAQDADLLCRRAEMALDEAQRRGELCLIYQSSGTQLEVFHDELRHAIEANRLQVFLQPIRELPSGRVVAVESLARWTSARHGEVSPSSFVPFCEQNDLISALTRWSIDATLRHAAPLCATEGLSFAINLSPQAFSRPDMVAQFQGALDIWGVQPTSVIAEVTETALTSDLDSGVHVLRQLRDMGVRISIDDFGTGYASISYLHRFPATELKIDKSLVGSMQEDPHTTRLVGAIINMAHHLDLLTVAEGIENQPTEDLLAGMGCDFGQGYHLGRPEAAADFVRRFQAAPTG